MALLCGCDLCGFACTDHGRQRLCMPINSMWLLSLRSLCMHVHMPDGFSDVCMYMYEQIVEVRGRCLVYFCLSPPYFLRASLSLKLELNVARLANLDSSRELSVSSTPDESTGVSFPIGAGTANTASPACTAISQHQHSAPEPLCSGCCERSPSIGWLNNRFISHSSGF